MHVADDVAGTQHLFKGFDHAIALDRVFFLLDLGDLLIECRDFLGLGVLDVCLRHINQRFQRGPALGDGFFHRLFVPHPGVIKGFDRLT
ncbi:hypothetical protein D3C85_1193410 [compost metagenome]